MCLESNRGGADDSKIFVSLSKLKVPVFIHPAMVSTPTEYGALGLPVCIAIRPDWLNLTPHP